MVLARIIIMEGIEMAKTPKNSPLSLQKVEQIKAMHTAGIHNAEIARKVGCAKSTVAKYIATMETDELEHLRIQKKAEFISQAWSAIQKSADLINRKLDEISSDGAKLTKAQLTQLATTLGILYDKQALAVGDPTLIQRDVVTWDDLDDD